jgi:hypothetical protein
MERGVVLGVIRLGRLVARRLNAAGCFHVSKMRPRDYGVLVDVGRERLPANGDEQLTRFLLERDERRAVGSKGSRAAQHSHGDQRIEPLFETRCFHSFFPATPRGVILALR